MPCADSSSSIVLKLDSQDRFVDFDFAKITCGQEITAETGYKAHCRGRTLQEIFDWDFERVQSALGVEGEEAVFILYLEWDALRSVIAAYTGWESQTVDRERCLISSIESAETGVEVALVMLPPRDLPPITACAKEVAECSQRQKKLE